jgi:hypothetical protein
MKHLVGMNAEAGALFILHVINSSGVFTVADRRPQPCCNQPT